MYKILFYCDRKGTVPVEETIEEYRNGYGKINRLYYEKIIDYISILEENGLSAGEPFVKYLEDGIWELRPLRRRILFFAWKDNTYVVLHTFYKQTNKTPRKEIEKALRERKDFIERMEDV